MLILQEIQKSSDTYDHYDPYNELAMAIIKQAADDYRKLGSRLIRCHDEEEVAIINRDMKGISCFFFSDWCSTLSNPDFGPQLLEQLDEEVFAE